MVELETALVAWANQLPFWQRDLLRRVAEGEVLSTDAIESFKDVVLQGFEVDDLPWYESPGDFDGMELNPLTADHLQRTSSSEPPTFLTKTHHLDGANNLAPGASLDFAPRAGMTIIAGRNGTGKSGYTRIIKQVARTRVQEDVIPNAFKNDTIPSAIVHYQLGQLQGSEFTWRHGAENTSRDLRRIRVFDSKEAAKLVGTSNDVAYIPPALDILSDFTSALGQIGSRIDEVLQQTELKNRTFDELDSGEGREILTSLGTSLGLRRLIDLKPLTEEEERELERLPAQISQVAVGSPAQLASLHSNRSSQIRTLELRVKEVVDNFGPSATADLVAIRGRLAAAERTARARALEENDSEFATVETKEWRALWSSAIDFSSAHSSETFPHSEHGRDCPLCGQKISEQAQTRIQKISAFLEDESRKKVDSAQEVWTEALDRIASVELDILTGERVELLESLGSDSVSSAIEMITSHANQVRRRLTSSMSIDISDSRSRRVPVLGQEVLDSLAQFRGLEDAEVLRLKNVEEDANLITRLRERFACLSLRKRLLDKRSALGRQHDLQIWANLLKRAKKSCSTGRVSRKHGELAQEYVAKVCGQFETEAKNLGIARVPVELTYDKTSKGTSYVKVSLKGSTAAPREVLSEGEQRVTAIAGFFADLTESADKSTLVFDDPTSSLDHEFRTDVARRLIVEANERQVLVFTHDFTFVQYLFEEKRTIDLERGAQGLEATGDIGYLHIDRTPEGSGVTTTESEWRHASVAKMTGRIKDRIQGLRSLYKSDDPVAYRNQASDVVGSIRVAWEALVEQVLLNNVVVRHERGVSTKRLQKVLKLQDRDVKAVELGMTIESRFLTGHSAPVGDASRALSPDELQREINNLEAVRMRHSG